MGGWKRKACGLKEANLTGALVFDAADYDLVATHFMYVKGEQSERRERGEKRKRNTCKKEKPKKPKNTKTKTEQ